MRICITGANGYLGQKLSESLAKHGYEIVPIKRRLLYGKVNDLMEVIRDTDVIINLAGAPIMQRWTTKNKQTIYSSRVDTTIKLVDAVQKLPKKNRPATFISASAVGIYKTWGTHDEESTQFDHGFSGTVVQSWEKASEPIPNSIRRVVFRTGVVLGKHSQTMKKVVPLFRLGLGGKIGSGKQPFPYIHVNDLLHAFESAIFNNNFKGIYNLVAPEQIDNGEFTRCLAQKLKRPAIVHVPSFIIRLVFGEASVLLLNGSQIIPKRLLENGFEFKYPTIEKVVDQILSS